MQINLNRNKKITNDLNAGDIVVYRSGTEESYYMIIVDYTSKSKCKLLDLSDGTIAIAWNNKEDMIKDIIESDNGWFFNRIIKSDELELRRIDI